VSLFNSYDGTSLSYDVIGEGPPLVCIPGGPGRAAEYLGDLGGLSRSHQLIRLDLRGVGRSSSEVDPATLRADRLVLDVEALRLTLGLDRMNLLAHSAGAILGMLYAARFPENLASLLLITPGMAAIGIHRSLDDRPTPGSQPGDVPTKDAVGALVKLMQGDLSAETFLASRPCLYARWDDAAQTNAGIGFSEGFMPARVGYGRDLTLDAASTAAELHELTSPVLLYVGELDPLVTPAMAREADAIFHDSTMIVQPGALHFPWVDDGDAFSESVRAFLARSGIPIRPDRTQATRRGRVRSHLSPGGSSSRANARCVPQP